MSGQENGFFTLYNDTFQPVVGYKETEKSPLLVVRQTHTLLELYYRGAISNPKPAKDYLHDYTLGYLKSAEEGSGAYYDRFGQFTVKDVDLEAREAAGHALVVLSCLPDQTKSPFLPKGFSRRGMLKAPETHDQFLKRMKELKIGIWDVVEGHVEPNATLEAYPKTLRVFKFFEVGSRLPINLTESEKKIAIIEREKFNDLLGGIDTSV
ncbi:MAG: hypothetical protein Q7R43_04275 [Candidatus Daviesbacteria bacterium]|nr:hypothetical protein [Candidatus Daviesbacteria bacterium]